MNYLNLHNTICRYSLYKLIFYHNVIVSKYLHYHNTFIKNIWLQKKKNVERVNRWTNCTTTISRWYCAMTWQVHNLLSIKYKSTRPEFNSQQEQAFALYMFYYWIWVLMKYICEFISSSSSSSIYKSLLNIYITNKLFTYFGFRSIRGICQWYL